MLPRQLAPVLLHHWDIASQPPACVYGSIGHGSIPLLNVGDQQVLPCLQVSWQRVRVANWLAHTGQEWVQLLDTLNSGTYNNQYMARLAAACL